MAATLAKVIGVDRSGRMKDTTRLGSDHVITQAQTWQTFVEVVLWADGHGYIEVRRNETPSDQSPSKAPIVHRIELDAESLTLVSTRKSRRR